jgi:hypothetical protein
MKVTGTLPRGSKSLFYNKMKVVSKSIIINNRTCSAIEYPLD